MDEQPLWTENRPQAIKRKNEGGIIVLWNHKRSLAGRRARLQKPHQWSETARNISYGEVALQLINEWSRRSFPESKGEAEMECTTHSTKSPRAVPCNPPPAFCYSCKCVETIGIPECNTAPACVCACMALPQHIQAAHWRERAANISTDVGSEHVYSWPNLKPECASCDFSVS